MSDHKKEQPKPPAAPLDARNAGHTKGPEPERFKIEGYANWEDAVKVALRKPKPPGGWPKR
jgi:hypothetical protein